MVDRLWIDNPAVLYQPNLLYHFFPTESMTTNEKWNAAIRGAFYIGIILFITGSSGLSSLMLVVIIMITSIGVTYYNQYSNQSRYTLYNKSDNKYYDNVNNENFVSGNINSESENETINNPFQSNPAELSSF